MNYKIQKNRLILLGVLLINVTIISAQKLTNIVPLSPNAAAIAKYGEIPVSHFTGIPNIQIPIYTIKTADFELPLSLNYHAGGNKVESIASWVGLGWSLNSIPCISRSVRGLPDEEAGGYFTKYHGKTVKEIWNEMLAGNTSTYTQFLAEFKPGYADSEPDIFFYNLPEESGKFFYNQEHENFITIPKSKTIIKRDGVNFRLITDKGNEYILNEKEVNTQMTSFQSDPITTTWYASKIILANDDEINFIYYPNIQHIFKTRSADTKYQFVGFGPSPGVTELPQNGSIMTTNYIDAQLLKQIDFKGGSVKFNKSPAVRTDLTGGYSLDNIEVYNTDNKVSKFKFSYKFLQGSSCLNEDPETKYWMLLEKFESLSSDELVSLPYIFSYDETYKPKCRNSAAQDYWGYYNGEDENLNLIPSVYMPYQNPPIIIQGANRQIDPERSKFAIIERIEYPTGGSTEFEFENNMAFSENIEPQYDVEYISLAGDDFFGPEDNIPAIGTYESDIFTINNPPDPYLNDENPEGGANLSFELANPGCDLSGGANSCARFTFRGASPENSNIIFDITDNICFYMPNGSYKLVASFDQDPPLYEGFVFLAKWHIQATPDNVNRYVGGLRIKEIKSFTNTLPSSNPIVKRYRYTIDESSTTSSGDLFSAPDYKFTDIIQYKTDVLDSYWQTFDYLRIRSFTNCQQVTHSGSYIGYKYVMEEIGSIDKTGYTTYEFSNKRDDQNVFFPYPPSKSNELHRGQLLKKTNYKKSGTDFKKVNEKLITYTTVPYDTHNNESSFAIKWGFLTFKKNPDPLIDNFPQVNSYTVDGGWSGILKETNSTYDENNILIDSINYFYDNPVHLYVNRKEIKNSDLKVQKFQYSYPLDYDTTQVLQIIARNNIVGKPIDTRTYKGAQLVSGTQTRFNDDGQPTDIYKAEIGEGVIDILFDTDDPYTFTHKATLNYNEKVIKEVIPENNLNTTYLWDSSNTFVMAKVENVSYSKISSLDGKLYSYNSETLHNEIKGLVANAMITTFTHKPLVGVTQQTDIAGRTTYFEYDDFGRLRLIRDQNNNIISKNEYHYTAQ